MMSFLHLHTGDLLQILDILVILGPSVQVNPLIFQIF